MSLVNATVATTGGPDNHAANKTENAIKIGKRAKTSPMIPTAPTNQHGIEKIKVITLKIFITRGAFLKSVKKTEMKAIKLGKISTAEIIRTSKKMSGYSLGGGKPFALK